MDVKGSGLIARFMPSAKVDAKVTTSSPDILGKGGQVNKDGTYSFKLLFYLLS